MEEVLCEIFLNMFQWLLIAYNQTSLVDGYGKKLALCHNKSRLDKQKLSRANLKSFFVDDKQSKHEHMAH